MTQVPVIDMIATGQNITRLRRQAGVSVRDIQTVFGFSTPQAIYKWQRGLSMPTLDNLIVLAHMLNTSMDQIIIQRAS